MQLFYTLMFIYQNIKKIARRKNITNKQLAEAFGITDQTMTNYLTGRTKIIADHIPLYAKVLRVGIAELFQEDWNPGKYVQPDVSVDIANESQDCQSCKEKDAEIYRLRNKLFDVQEKYTDAILELQNKKDQGKCG